MVSRTGNAVFRQTDELAPRLCRRPEVILLLTVLAAVAVMRGILWLSDNRSEEKVLASAKQYLMEHGTADRQSTYSLHRVAPCAWTFATGVAFKIHTDRGAWIGKVCWDGKSWRLADVAVVK